jgi:hypothetical protein
MGRFSAHSFASSGRVESILIARAKLSCVEEGPFARIFPRLGVSKRSPSARESLMTKSRVYGRAKEAGAVLGSAGVHSSPFSLIREFVYASRARYALSCKTGLESSCTVLRFREGVDGMTATTGGAVTVASAAAGAVVAAAREGPGGIGDCAGGRRLRRICRLQGRDGSRVHVEGNEPCQALADRFTRG